MIVAELYPCGGYFSRLLSDIVGPKGKIYGLETTRWAPCLPADQKMAAEPGRGNIVVDGQPFGEFILPQKVDLFWITQNYHDLHIGKYGTVDTAAFNRHVFDSLKPAAPISSSITRPPRHDARPDRGAASHRESADHPRSHRCRLQAQAEGDFLHQTYDDHTKNFRSVHSRKDGSVRIEIRQAVSCRA
jgi:predicted methyltransferase